MFRAHPNNMETPAKHQPKTSFIKVRNILLVIFIITFSFSGGYLFGIKGFQVQFKDQYKIKVNRITPPEKNVDFSLFWRVWDTLGSKYFDKTKLVPSEMIYGAISGMVSAVGDPYTSFLPPKENKIVNEDLSGSFEGVGIQIGFKSSRLAVISPLPDSPGEKAGIKAGDYIVKIKDETKNIDMITQGISLPEAVQIIRGKAGTEVILTLVRDGVDKPIEVKVIRAKLDIASVELKFVGTSSNIAHLKINKFGAETVDEWDKSIKQITDKGNDLNGIVIDLRNNPGGYMQAAIDMASEFIALGKVVVIEEHGDGSRKEYKVIKNGKLTNEDRVIILVNGGSASASEILSGALRDQRQFKLMGEKSFGKGTIQEPVEITGGSGLHVTIAKWLTPNGTWVHDKGLMPEIEIEDNEETFEIDEQLQKAIETLEKN